MIRDLELDDPGTVAADVCVIGSGPAGLAFAREAAALGLTVVILEAGGAIASSPRQDGTVRFAQTPYAGATRGRAVGWGGTCALWGGQLLPLRAGEMIERPEVGAPAWPIEFSELTEHYAAVLHWCDITCETFEAAACTAGGAPWADFAWGDFTPRCSAWIAFRGRNLARAWAGELFDGGRVSAWLNARVVQWEGDDTTGEIRVGLAHARSPNGRCVSIRADQFVICAGALDSPLLLFELLRRFSTRAGSLPWLGRSLQDHLSIRIAELRLKDRPRFSRLFAPIFEGSTMRSLRIDLSIQVCRREGLPAAYAHFVVDTPLESGFAIVRDTLRAMQAGEMRRGIVNAGKGIARIPEIAQIAYWRVARKRLAVPHEAKVFVHVDFEHPSAGTNRVYGEVTPGNPFSTLVIDWDPARLPRNLLARVKSELNDFWKENRLEQVADLLFIGADEDEARAGNLYDIYHPACTTRMGTGADNGVVDSNLRVFGTQNCYVASSSVFPSMGAANPTLTIMALSRRLAAHLGARRGQSQAARISHGQRTVRKACIESPAKDG